VGFVVHKVVLGQVFLRVLRFALSKSFHSVMYHPSGGWAMVPLAAHFYRSIVSPHNNNKKEISSSYVLCIRIYVSSTATFKEHVTKLSKLPTAAKEKVQQIVLNSLLQHITLHTCQYQFAGFNIISITATFMNSSSLPFRA
jgi:hypothetical protein